MSERRRPEVVLNLKSETRGTVKVELFPLSRFGRTDRFTDRKGAPLRQNNLAHFYRLRIDGKWWPQAQRVVFSKRQCMAVLKKEIFS